MYQLGERVIVNGKSGVIVQIKYIELITYYLIWIEEARSYEWFY